VVVLVQKYARFYKEPGASAFSSTVRQLARNPGVEKRKNPISGDKMAFLQGRADFLHIFTQSGRPRN
jgi:hypothetical protein